MIRCGFFNSVNGDRKYSAEEMNEPFKGIISNGVLVPNADGTEQQLLSQASLKVVQSSGMNVIVRSGRGVFADKWFVNDTDLSLQVPGNSTLSVHKASVIVRIDNRSTGRKAEILLIQDTDKTKIPTINTIENVFEYRLANIDIPSGAVAITTANIYDKRASDECGFCHGLIKQLSTEELFDQWEAIFRTWFNNVQLDLKTHATLITKYESSYTTINERTTIVPINIPQYNQNLDALEVYINGLQLVRGTDYNLTLNDNTKITLTKDVYRGTIVSFVVYKSIDGSEASTVVTQVNQLQNQVNSLISDTGWINLTLEGGAEAYPGLTPAIRKVGKIVYIRGAIYKVTNPQHVVCTLPEAYAPTLEHYFSQVVGGTGSGVGYTAVRFKVNRNRASGGAATLILNGATSSININMTIPLSTSFIVD